jgi:hypothetical protein
LPFHISVESTGEVSAGATHPHSLNPSVDDECAARERRHTSGERREKCDSDTHDYFVCQLRGHFSQASRRHQPVLTDRYNLILTLSRHYCSISISASGSASASISARTRCCNSKTAVRRGS